MYYYFFFYLGELSLNVIRDNGELANCVLVRLVPIASLDRATDLFVFNYDSICNFEEPNRGSCLLKILLQGLLFKFNGKEVRKPGHGRPILRNKLINRLTSSKGRKRYLLDKDIYILWIAQYDPMKSDSSVR